TVRRPAPSVCAPRRRGDPGRGAAGRLRRYQHRNHPPGPARRTRAGPVEGSAMTVKDLAVTPMPAERVPAYFRGFVDWYAEALAELGPRADEDLHAHVAEYLRPWLGTDGLPLASTVFDILVGAAPTPVGAAWCGSTDFGFGPIFYIHDLRIFAPWRRLG